MIRKLQPKSVFASSTIQGTILTTISTVLLAILPSVQRIIDNHVKNEQTQRDVQEIIFIVNTVFTILGIGGAGTAVAGRVSVGDLWTPHGVPGPNKEDFKSYNLPEKVEFRLLPSSPDTASELPLEIQNLEGGTDEQSVASSDTASELPLETQNLEGGTDEQSVALSSSNEIKAQVQPAPLLKEQDKQVANLIAADNQTTEAVKSVESNIAGSERSPASPKKKEPTYWSSKKKSSPG